MGAERGPAEAEVLDGEAGDQRAVGQGRFQGLRLEIVLFGEVAHHAAGKTVAGAGRIDDVLERLERVGLLDDEQFARDLAQQAFTVKRSGQRAVASALFAKGVSRETVETVTAEYDGGDPGRALELARSRAARMGDLEPAKAYRRLTELLMRRGHSPSVAREAAGKALGRDLEEA